MGQDLKVGDLVTRDGTDVHEVLSLSDEGLCANFRCVRRPDSGWCEVGEDEFNLIARYSKLNTA